MEEGCRLPFVTCRICIIREVSAYRVPYPIRDAFPFPLPNQRRTRRLARIDRIRLTTLLSFCTSCPSCSKSPFFLEATCRIYKSWRNRLEASDKTERAIRCFHHEKSTKEYRVSILWKNQISSFGWFLATIDIGRLKTWWQLEQFFYINFSWNLLKSEVLPRVLPF